MGRASRDPVSGGIFCPIFASQKLVKNIAKKSQKSTNCRFLRFLAADYCRQPGVLFFLRGKLVGKAKSGARQFFAIFSQNFLRKFWLKLLPVGWSQIFHFEKFSKIWPLHWCEWPRPNYLIMIILKGAFFFFGVKMEKMREGRKWRRKNGRKWGKLEGKWGGEGKKWEKLRRERGDEEKLGKNWGKIRVKTQPLPSPLKKWENRAKTGTCKAKIDHFYLFLGKNLGVAKLHTVGWSHPCWFLNSRDFSIFENREKSRKEMKYYYI